MLKEFFPGDPDFTVGRYGDLSYGYVLQAISIGSKARQETLYQNELPIAQQSAIIANQNRDKKRKIEPYSAKDFCLYKPAERSDAPSSVYGSAAIAMVENGTFPSWALFCFKELLAIADESYKPFVTALVSPDAILLHPSKIEGGYRGMLIAREAASNQLVEFKHPDGSTVILTMPPVVTKVIAEEGVTLFP
tara:strand:- start:489 stop:1064 length:576 start_codon:yes stop_codon:yes gene_type:complete